MYEYTRVHVSSPLSFVSIPPVSSDAGPIDRSYTTRYVLDNNNDNNITGYKCRRSERAHARVLRLGMTALLPSGRCKRGNADTDEICGPTVGHLLPSVESSGPPQVVCTDTPNADAAV